MWLNVIFVWENHSRALPWIKYIHLPQAYGVMSLLCHTCIIFFPLFSTEERWVLLRLMLSQISVCAHIWNLQTLFWFRKATSTIHCVSIWNIICLIFAGWTFYYLCTTTFILAEKCVRKTLAYNWGVNNEKASSVILDSILFAWTPAFSSLYPAQLKKAFLVEHPIAWYQVWNQSGVTWEGEMKWKFTQELRLSKSQLLTNQS